MRTIVLGALAAASVLFCLPEYSVAQERRAVVARAQPVPPPLNPNARFRPRSATERAADAARLGVLVDPSQLGTPFSITPRAPVIVGRASMETTWTSLDASFDTTGRLRGQTNRNSDVSFWIYNTGNRRFLVDCKVSSFAPLPFRMVAVGGASGNQAIVSDVYAQGGLASFVTQHIPERALIGVSLVPPANANDVYAWDFMGCEVTPLPG